MNELTLTEYLKEYLHWQLSDHSFEIEILCEELADNLKTRGYCTDPYIEYDRALMCPINKRKEKFCNNTHCHSYDFCVTLRKEEYI